MKKPTPLSIAATIAIVLLMIDVAWLNWRVIQLKADRTPSIEDFSREILKSGGRRSPVLKSEDYGERAWPKMSVERPVTGLFPKPSPTPNPDDELDRSGRDRRSPVADAIKLFEPAPARAAPAAPAPAPAAPAAPQ